MKRIDYHLKVEVDLEEDENPDKFARELCRILEKVYGVRRAEVSATMRHGDK